MTDLHLMSLRGLARAAVCAALALSFPPSSDAATIVPPRDLAELATESDAVVLARGVSSSCSRRGALIFTTTEFVARDVVSGGFRAGDVFAVETPGGELDDGSRWIVDGSPELVVGESYLLMLQHKRDDLWILTTLAYGLLREMAAPDGSVLLAPSDPTARVMATFERLDATTAEPIGTYDAAGLLAHLSGVVIDGDRWESALVESSIDLEALSGEGAAPPGVCEFFVDSGRRFRWSTFDRGGSATIYADETGDHSIDGSFKIVHDALNKWHDITNCGLNLVLGGTRALDIGCGGGEDAQANTIVFNDPCSDIGDLTGCGGVLAYGGPLSPGSTHGFDGSSWLTVTGWIVVCNNGVGCLGTENYRRMLAHELGHGLGWGHVSDGNALMFANCCNNPNSTDRACARYTYPPLDSGNARPQVDAGGNRTLVLLGDTARVAGTVTDDGLPEGVEVRTRWRFLAGPAVASFADPTALETTVTFPQSGQYLIELQADDGELLRASAAQIDVTTRVGSVATASFQQGVGGYRGTVDTFLQEDAPSADNAGSSEVNVDTDDPSGSGRIVQSLLRFDGIFGLDSGRIVPGAEIRSAVLELTTTNPGDGATLHRMLDAWDEDVSWNAFDGGIDRGIECDSAIDATTAGDATLVRVDVTSSVAAWAADPCSNFGWALLPIDTDGWDFESSEGATPPRLVVEFAVARERELVAVGDAWRYFKGTTAPPDGWNEPGFATGPEWLIGPTGIGFGDGDDATVVGDMRGNYSSLFLRRELDLANIGSTGDLRLHVDYDDGFVAYLNGVEVARSATLGDRGDPIDQTTLAGSHEASGAFEEFRVDASLLRPGTNVLAAQVHNSSLTSSDLSFIPRLAASSNLIDGDSEWRFLRGSLPLPADWSEPVFDDSEWERGPGSIGYGDGDDVTELDDMRDGYLTVFCRRAFEIADAASVGDLRMTTIYDDGIVVSLNGVEVDRRNMPGGAIATNTAASGSIEPRVESITLPGDLLVDGTNVLAVSVHNAALDSSDLSFAALLAPFGESPEDIDCDAEPEPVFRFQRGDIGNDGDLNLSDAVKLLDFLFTGGSALDCEDAADIDDNGTLAINDAVKLLNYLFLGTEAPPAPGASCGVDPTPDAFADCRSSGCPED